MNPSALTTPTASSVPVEYAEKAMGSLMKLHGELMEEKERRVDLYRRLMEKEQALAELKMYVKLLEEKVAAPSAKTPAAQTEPVREPLRVVRTPNASNMPRHAPKPPPRPARAPKPADPRPVRAAAAPGAQVASPGAAPQERRAVADGWKSW